MIFHSCVAKTLIFGMILKKSVGEIYTFCEDQPALVVLPAERERIMYKLCSRLTGLVEGLHFVMILYLASAPT